ncbi:MAG: alpha/beta hydrolase, partial [Verrucomicrobia bacterium]|nr:alpha/beta hydrolase [Verrucomicrobiota bacterium]
NSQVLSGVSNSQGVEARIIASQSVISAWLRVDQNRDGRMTTSDILTNTAEKPFRFWSNDDDDYVVGTETKDRVPVQFADWKNRQPDTVRDLEDFTRLQLYIGGLHEAIKAGNLYIGLKWTDTNSTNPGVRIFRNLDSTGRTGFLTDTDIANNQSNQTCILDASLPVGSVNQTGVVTGGGAYVLPSSLFSDLTAATPSTHLLFEGCITGKGQLKLIILKKENGNYTEIGEGPGVWLDIKNIRDLYARVRVTPEDADELVALPLPYRNAATFDENQSNYQAEAFTAPSNEEKKVLIFVHGSNEQEPESRNRAETMYKRLWHQGYKGRLVFFHWDTLVGYMDGEYPVGQYNMNEYVALKYGPALKKYRATLPTNYTVNVISHSLGNGVVGSALKAGMTVNNYIMMQAAFSAKSYNASLPTLPRFQAAESLKATPDLAADRGYGGYLQGVQANIINMFNPVDFALATGTVAGLEANWEKNQIDYKPDDPPGIGQYYYGTYSQGTVSYTLNGTMGALAGVGGVVSEEVNIGEGTIYNFDRSRSDHSAEFNRNVQQTDAFYRFVFEKAR